MRVEVEHSASNLSIRWWPYDPDDIGLGYTSWAVYKRLDTTSYDLPLPVEPAFIVPGTSLGQRTDARRAREYAELCVQAAELAKQLDKALNRQEHFRHIFVKERPKNGEIRVEGYPWNEPDYWHVEIAIPDQSAYRAEAVEREA